MMVKPSNNIDYCWNNRTKHRSMEAKFLQNTDLKQVLMDTGERTLGEANPSDTMFGIGLSLRSNEAMDRSKWRGVNLLGQTLMDIRMDILTGDL